MQPVAKVAVAITTIGTIGGGVVGGYYAFNNSQNISGRLKEEGFSVLNTSKTSTDWNTVWTKYKAATKNTFSGQQDSNISEKQLRNKCAIALNQNPDHKDYQLARQWCVKEESINTILERGKYTILKNDGEKEDESSIWTTKVGILKQDTNKFPATKGKIKEQDIALNIAALKTECRNLTIDQVLTTTEGFGEKLELARDWCANK